MSTHNIGFYERMAKIIFQLSSNIIKYSTHFICSSGTQLHISVVRITDRSDMSRVVRKPAFCICENKGADQLHGNREADQRLCFRNTDSTIPLLPKSEILVIFSGCTAWFVSDLVGNPEDLFSHNEAHMISAVHH